MEREKFEYEREVRRQIEKQQKKRMLRSFRFLLKSIFIEEKERKMPCRKRMLLSQPIFIDDEHLVMDRFWLLCSVIFKNIPRKWMIINRRETAATTTRLCLRIFAITFRRNWNGDDFWQISHFRTQHQYALLSHCSFLCSPYWNKLNRDRRKINIHTNKRTRTK